MNDKTTKTLRLNNDMLQAVENYIYLEKKFYDVDTSLSSIITTAVFSYLADCMEDYAQSFKEGDVIRTFNTKTKMRSNKALVTKEDMDRIKNAYGAAMVYTSADLAEHDANMDKAWDLRNSVYKAKFDDEHMVYSSDNGYENIPSNQEHHHITYMSDGSIEVTTKENKKGE